MNRWPARSSSADDPVTGSTVAPPGAAPRVDVLSLPRTTTLRAVLLVAAMVSAGLVVGTMLHNLVLAGLWDARFRECTAVPDGGPGVLGEAFTECMAPVEQRRVAVALTMAALVLALSWVVVLVAPLVHGRRRKLRPLDGAYTHGQGRFAELAAEAGLRRPPVLMRGEGLNGVTDPHAYGRPGDPRVAVPLKLLALAGTPRADAVMRHELAHVSHRDVSFGWLAKGSWYVLGPLLLVPVVVAVVVGDLEVVPGYLARATVLAVVVQLVLAGLLRAREVDADLGRGPARAPDPAVMAAETAVAVTAGRSVVWGGCWPHTRRRPSARWLLQHRTWRLAWGSWTRSPPAFCAATALPVLRAAAASTIGGAPEREWIVVLSVVPVGVLLGATVGVGLVAPGRRGPGGRGARPHRTRRCRRGRGRPCRPVRLARRRRAGHYRGFRSAVDGPPAARGASRCNRARRGSWRTVGTSGRPVAESRRGLDACRGPRRGVVHRRGLGGGLAGDLARGGGLARDLRDPAGGPRRGGRSPWSPSCSPQQRASPSSPAARVGPPPAWLVPTPPWSAATRGPLGVPRLRTALGAGLLEARWVRGSSSPSRWQPVRQGTTTRSSSGPSSSCSSPQPPAWALAWRCSLPSDHRGSGPAAPWQHRSPPRSPASGSWGSTRPSVAE